jgi:hypothetical protein
MNIEQRVCHVTGHLMTEPTVNNSTFAGRNPTRAVIPSCSRGRKVLTNVEKLSADARRLLNKENADALQVELDGIFLHRKEEIARLSQKFNKTSDYIQRLLNIGTNYRKSRAPTLQNALIHHKSQEVNGGMLFPSSAFMIFQCHHF